MGKDKTFIELRQLNRIKIQRNEGTSWQKGHKEYCRIPCTPFTLYIYNTIIVVFPLQISR